MAITRAYAVTALRIRQSDKKTMIAYSSVRHMIVIIANIISVIPWSQKATIMSILRHGLVSPLMFLRAGTTVEQQKRKNNITTRVSKRSRSNPTL